MELSSAISAVVTGGASGLGEATARQLASRGVHIAIFDINQERGETIANELGGIFCRVNVASAPDVEAAFTRARDAIGQERILINCAGVGGSIKTVSRDKQTGQIIEYPFENFERVVGVNLFGTFRCISKSVAGMLTLDPLIGGDRGVVINTASVAAEEGQVGQVAYSASKAAIVGMTLTIARDLSNEAIRINTILPGIFDTPAMQRAREPVRAALSAQVPFPRRMGEPNEFAQLVETMITCGYFNGEDVRLDGAIRMPPR